MQEQSWSSQALRKQKMIRNQSWVQRAEPHSSITSWCRPQDSQLSSQEKFRDLLSQFPPCCMKKTGQSLAQLHSLPWTRSSLSRSFLKWGTSLEENICTKLHLTTINKSASSFFTVFYSQKYWRESKTRTLLCVHRKEILHWELCSS